MRTRLLLQPILLLAIILSSIARITWADERAGAFRARDAARSNENYVKPAESSARREYEKERGINFPVLVRGNPARREIALTFDDGPHAGKTEQLLDILRQEQVRATFFVVGKMVDKNPDLVRREIAEGHEVANHTYDHLRLADASDSTVEYELREGSRAIQRATGSPTRLFRPPGGEYDDDMIDVVKRLGYVMVLWTDDPGDFALPGSDIIEKRALKCVRNGAILLLHDGIQQTYDILPDLIHKLKRQGYKFVTISEMAREGGVVKTGGPRVPLPGSATARTSFAGTTSNSYQDGSLRVAGSRPGVATRASNASPDTGSKAQQWLKSQLDSRLPSSADGAGMQAAQLQTILRVRR